MTIEQDIYQEIEWRRNALALWQTVVDQKEYMLPVSVSERKSLAKYLKKQMDHNAEKYRDKEGREFYAKLAEIISTLDN